MNNNTGTRRGRGRARGRAREMPVPLEIPLGMARRGVGRLPIPVVVRLPRLRRQVIPPEIEIVDLADEPPPDMNRLPFPGLRAALLSPPPQVDEDGFRFAD